MMHSCLIVYFFLSICDNYIGSQNVDLDSDEWKDINVVAGALKQFLRELPEAVMTSAHYDALIAASGTTFLMFPFLLQQSLSLLLPESMMYINKYLSFSFAK